MATAASQVPDQVVSTAILFSAFGLGAGALTTIAGFGGGMFLTFALAAIAGPQAALAVAAPALLLGNLHRTYLFREHLDRKTTWLAAGVSLPVAFAGGLVTVNVPELWLKVLFVVLAVAAIAKKISVYRVELPPSENRFLLGFGLALSALVAAISGAGGLVLVPVLMAAGLSGPRFVAAASATAIFVHIGRIAGYGTAGAISSDTLWSSVVVAASIVGGNALGHNLRRFIPDRAQDGLTMGLLGTVLILSLLGVTN